MNLINCKVQNYCPFKNMFKFKCDYFKNEECKNSNYKKKDAWCLKYEQSKAMLRCVGEI